MGNTMEELSRIWQELVARDSGPMHVRLLIQPLVASFLALRSGLADARADRPAFFWAWARDSTQRDALSRQLWKDIGKLFIAACVLDVVYQLIVMHTVHPVQTLIVATLLAVLPYLVVRGLANRVGHWLGLHRRNGSSS
jgi:hypothetical protein